MAGEHSYEELRGITLDIFSGRAASNRSAPRDYNTLLTRVADEISQREQAPAGQHSFGESQLHPFDSDTMQEVFWDLFRQSIITLGCDGDPSFPFYHLT